MSNAYTDQQRAEALDLYIQVGTAETARQTGIPARTIRYWANQNALTAARNKNLQTGAAELATRHEHMRQELQVRLMEQALDALDHMNMPHKDYRGKDVTEVTWDEAPADAWRAYATTVGILIDKYRLERGEATERSEQHVSVTPTSERLSMVLDVLADLDALPTATSDGE